MLSAVLAEPTAARHDGCTSIIRLARGGAGVRSLTSP